MEKGTETSGDPILAICYDFDKTLTPDDMQAQGYIQSVGFDPAAFWKESNGLADKNEMDLNLAYMLKMKEEAEGRIVFTKEKLAEYGGKIKLFPGVEDWFSRTEKMGKKYSVQVEHYVISSGLKEMIEGSVLFKNGAFKKVYASSFYYNDRGVAVWPAQVVNYTNKTQFLFRISKGCLDINDPAINDYYPPEKLRVPFKNIVYIGDSDTDVPCMKLVNQNGGYSIGVFDPMKGNRDKVYKMFREQRISYFLPADYSDGSELDELLHRIILSVSFRSQLEKISQKNNEEARFHKKDSDLAQAVHDLKELKNNAGVDWNGLMNNPDLLMRVLTSSKEMHESLFHKAVCELLNQI